MYIPKHFSTTECFPTHSIAPNWGLFDERVLISADQLREVFGPLSCNINGYTQCGYRTNGSLTSQHRHGRALDLHTTKYSYYEIRKYILEHQNVFPYISFLECDISWLHIDVRNCSPITLWSPNRGFLTKEEYIIS